MPLIVPRYRPITRQPNHNTARLERIFTKLTPIRRCARRIVNPKEEAAVTLSSSPLPAGPGWAGWVIMALVVIAFWTVPIAAMLALFPVSHRNRRQRRSSRD
jgi:hypothetical protein